MPYLQGWPPKAPRAKPKGHILEVLRPQSLQLGTFWGHWICSGPLAPSHLLYCRVFVGRTLAIFARLAAKGSQSKTKRSLFGGSQAPKSPTRDLLGSTKYPQGHWLQAISCIAGCLWAEPYRYLQGWRPKAPRAKPKGLHLEVLRPQSLQYLLGSTKYPQGH